MPAAFTPHQTCLRRYRYLKRIGAFQLVLSALNQDLRQRGRLDVVRALRQGSIWVENRSSGWQT